MGCDIHMYVEVNNDGVWSAKPGKNPMHSWYMARANEAPTETDRQAEIRKAAQYNRDVYAGWFYDGRNYNLFSVLADVRNYDGIEPIDEPRELPEDVSVLVAQEYEGWGCDAHSATYFTVRELLEFDWDQEYTQHGMVRKDVAEAYYKTGELPTSWCGGTTNPDYVNLEWKLKYSDMCADFITRLHRLVKDTGKDPDDIRLVMWFDN